MQPQHPITIHLHHFNCLCDLQFGATLPITRAAAPTAAAQQRHSKHMDQWHHLPCASHRTSNNGRSGGVGIFLGNHLTGDQVVDGNLHVQVGVVLVRLRNKNRHWRARGWSVLCVVFPSLLNKIYCSGIRSSSGTSHSPSSSSSFSSPALASE